MTKILVPRASGVLSALGLAAADRRGRRAAHRPAATTTLRRRRAARRGRRGPRRRAARSRWPGTCATTASRTSSPSAARERDELRERFEALHEERYGYRDPDGERRARHRARHRPAARPRRSTSARPPARRSRGRPSSRCPRRRSSCPRAGAARPTTPGTLVLERGASEPSTRSPCRSSAGALRAACEEMGAVLVRSAHSRQHQGAPRLLDRAVRRRRRDGHAGRAHPGAPRRDARRGRRRARPRPRRGRARGSSTTPTPAARTCPTSRSSRPPSHDGELLGFAAARAHHADVGGARAGLDAGGLDDARRGGRRDRAARARRRRDRRARRADAPARPAPRRPARPARGQPHRRAARCGELADRVGVDCLREATAAVLDYAERRTRACLADARRRHAHAPSTCSRRAEGDLELRVAATVDGDELTLDFTGSAAQHEGNLNCPLAVTRERVPVRRARAHRPRHPAQRGRLPPDHRRRARGLAAQRALARGGRRRQRRDVLARRRPRARRLRPRAGPGHDEQPDPRHRRARPTTRRSAAARARARTPTARAPCTSRCRTRSTRRSRRSSSSSRCASTEYALRRGSGGAGRHRGGDGVVRELEALDRHDLLAAHRAPPPRAARRRRRRARRAAGATCSTARSSSRRPSGTLRAGQRLRIETPGAAAVTGSLRRTETASPRGVSLPAFGPGARRFAANCPALWLQDDL